MYVMQVRDALSCGFYPREGVYVITLWKGKMRDKDNLEADNMAHLAEDVWIPEHVRELAKKKEACVTATAQCVP